MVSLVYFLGRYFPIEYMAPRKNQRRKRGGAVSVRGGAAAAVPVL